jgi:multicomponent Na+:H+ antiporter subunit G
MNGIMEIASAACLLAGGFFCLVGAVGLLRMPDFYTRTHAAGLALEAGMTLVTAKLLIIGLLIFFTSPTATHALAKAALARGIQPLLGRVRKRH